MCRSNFSHATITVAGQAGSVVLAALLATSGTCARAAPAASPIPEMTAPRVLRISIPESSIRVFARESGQTSLNSARIHGVRVGSLRSKAFIGDLLVYGGATQTRAFCVDIVRINNLFGLSFTFTAPKNADIYSLRFRTQAWASQLPVTSGEMAVRVRASSGGQCRGPMLAAGWESPGDLIETWVPYNAGQASSARMQVGMGSAEACISVKEVLPQDVQAVQYNYICKVAHAPSGCGTTTTVQVQRDMGPRSEPEIDSMDIDLPCISARR